MTMRDGDMVAGYGYDHGGCHGGDGELNGDGECVVCGVW